MALKVRPEAGIGAPPGRKNGPIRAISSAPHANSRKAIPLSISLPKKLPRQRARGVVAWDYSTRISHNLAVVWPFDFAPKNHKASIGDKLDLAKIANE